MNEKIVSKSSDPNPMKNFNAVGKIKKNENAIPAKNKITDDGTIKPKTARSDFVNAGKKNRHTWKKTTGRAIKNPVTMSIFKYVKNASPGCM